MTEFVFANNFQTFLEQPVSTTATVLFTASAAGLPTINPGQQIPMTLASGKSNQGPYEIVYATQIIGNTISVLRGQEGTTAQEWNTADRLQCGPTAATVMPMGYPELIPVGGLLEIASVMYSQENFPNFVECNGTNTLPGSDVNQTLLPAFQDAGFVSASIPILGSNQTKFYAKAIASNGSGTSVAIPESTNNDMRSPAVPWGLFLVTTDGQIWKSVSIGVSAVWADIIWDGSQFVALSESGIIATSATGTGSWSVSQPLSNGGFSGIAYGNGTYVATGFYTYYSENLVNWTYSNGPVNMRSITWNGSVFCVVNPDIIYTSSNGAAWTAATSPSTAVGLYLAASSGSTICLVGSDENSTTQASNFATSTDNGSTWTTGTLPGGSYNALLGAPNGFLAMCGWPNANSAASPDNSTSADGLTWSTASGIWANAVGWNGTEYVTVSPNIAFPLLTATGAYNSANGQTWNNYPIQGPGSAGNWTAVAYGAGQFVALQSGTNQVATSPDGEHWAQSQALPTSANWSALAWNGSQFVGIATGSDIAVYSADGNSWTQATLPSSAEWSSLAWNGSTWCAIAGASAGSTTAAVSSNGSTWTASTLPESLNWSAIAALGDTFCAIANGSAYTATSTNGTSWTANSSALPFADAWGYLASNGTNFLAVTEGSGAQAATSLDGVSWPSETVPTGFNGGPVVWNGSDYVIVASGEAYGWTTETGETYQKVYLPGALSWSGVASNGAGTSVAIANGSNTVGALSANSNIFLAPSFTATDSRFIYIMRVI